jgi:hypothetical protein
MVAMKLVFFDAQNFTILRSDKAFSFALLMTYNWQAMFSFEFLKDLIMLGQSHTDILPRS